MADLANKFISFFGEKIITIRHELESNPKQGTYLCSEVTVATTRLHRLSCPSYSTLLQIVHPLASKSCELDPVPSRILLGCLDLLCPVIWKIVKLSLETSVMPTELKQAVIRPLLKKPSLDYQGFKNFRPISNLTFLSKVIEKVVALQLVVYIDNNGLCEVFQSAFRAHHSTETALLRVYNDIAMSIDNQKSVVLVLLDLSAAFDTVDHSLLLARLSTRFGICDQALDWFRSYLSDRTQYVRIQDVSSDVHALPYGVPQGSVLGPLLYSLYTSPLGDIARSHGLSYHFYADDTQLYLSFETLSPEDLSTCTSALEDCVNDINLWMLNNKLKLNSGKTEIIVFSSSYRTRPTLKNLVIASDTVDCSTTAENIGVIFNNSLSMLPHVTAVCKSSFFHLRNIFKICKFLSHDTCKTLIHAFVTARIDYCNSLLYGQPKCILKRLQSVLNSAARLIHLTSRYEHVTPLLIQLHWLPIE